MRRLAVVAAMLLGCGGGQPLDFGGGGAGGAGGGGSVETGGAGGADAATMGQTLPPGPTFPCGPDGAGLACSCGSGPYFPAPPGSLPVEPFSSDIGAHPGYATVAEFDALVVGRWVRTAGMSELHCEQYGLDFTADHRVVPLVIASDGSVQPIPAMAQAFALDLRSSTPALVLDGGGFITNAPLFPAGRDAMYFLFDPWPATYARVP